jgi:threonine dehydratase
VSHVRTGVDLEIDEVEIEVQVETKGPEHCDRLLQRLRDDGFRLAEH